ncbi:hypothetical protein Gotur_027835 [Gossypium turneri]
MKRVWKNSKAVFSLLLVTILLSMATSGSLLAEAKIPDFLAIQVGSFKFDLEFHVEIKVGNGHYYKWYTLKRGIQRRNLKPLPPGGGTPPKPNNPTQQLPPFGYK